MRLEAREIPDYAEPVKPDQLKVGEVYWAVRFIDQDMLIPTLEPRVFIGRDLESGDSGLLYFRDAPSYFRTATEESEGIVVTMHESDLTYLFEFDRALDRLLVCSERRRRR